MKYNFDEIIDRTNTNCEKYDSREEIFGNANVIPLWVADTDFRTPKFIVDAVKERAAHEVYGYPKKPDSYYNSIQSWLLRRHNWEIQKEWIAYSPNVVICLSSLILSLTKPSDKIVVQPPVYFPFFHVIEGNGRVMVENQLKLEDGRYRFDFEDLKSKIDKDTKMLLLCNPHNPGGTVWTKDELTELGNICIENDVLIVSDEIHADLIYKGYKHVPFASISEEFAQNSITTMSASKTFNIAGLSSAFMICPNKKLLHAYNKLMRATHISSGNFFGLVATEAAYTHGDEWLSQLLVYLEENYKYIEAYLSEHLPKLKVMKPEGTYLLWIDVSDLSIEPKKAFEALVKGGLGLSPGNMFGKGGEKYIRLNMGCPKSILEEALPLMKKALGEF
ncbi:MAG: PatB family C-S lyase [Prolixibacteraceae bacterium]|jgi:cystathionine beta-lyase|nr:PatB family C-S lyase [Prolixibacteraceae bacterium]